VRLLVPLLTSCVASVVMLSSAPVARASGETLTASPARARVGAAVRLTYSLNGQCGERETASFFFDASPVGSAAVNQQTCTAGLTFTVPSTSCGGHRFSAAWHYPGKALLYAQATAAFTVTCTGQTASPTPTARRTAAAPTPTRSLAPSPPRVATRRPAVTATRSAVPVVSAVPTPVAPGPTASDEGGGGRVRWVVAAVLAGLVGLALARRRVRSRAR
jgi:hypothetical protein